MDCTRRALRLAQQVLFTGILVKVGAESGGNHHQHNCSGRSWRHVEAVLLFQSRATDLATVRNGLLDAGEDLVSGRVPASGHARTRSRCGWRTQELSRKSLLVEGQPRMMITLSGLDRNMNFRSHDLLTLMGMQVNELVHIQGGASAYTPTFAH